MSRLGILNLGARQHFVAKIPAQILWGAKVHSPPKQRREVLFNVKQVEKARNMTWFEFHQHVHIAIGPEIFAQHRAE